MAGFRRLLLLSHKRGACRTRPNMVAREPHVVPDNENVKRGARKMFRKGLAASGRARRPDVPGNIVPGGAEIFDDR
ncbi:hypothetical protein D0C28_15660 [Rhizobium sp. AU243]|nr:hypothetical protein D0C28_15660 [Rhizobium sp. AU243]